MQREILTNVERHFHRLYQTDALLIRSPGRINLIGEHTDYNSGMVLPAAIDRAIIFAISLRNDNHCRLYAVDLDEYDEFFIDSYQRSTKGWANYLIGVVDQLKKKGIPLAGFNCAFGGDIPIGAGLSSSAAIEAGLAVALNKLFDLKLGNWTLVKLARKAENEFVGVNCGIMDQFINIFGKKNQAVLLDCRSLEYQYYPFLNEKFAILLCDTRIHRELASSEYNIRRAQCEAAVKKLRQFDPAIESLRDAELVFLEDHQRDLDPLLYKRAKYVVQENERVLSACQDLERGDFESFGRRMYESHQGLRDDYEVSSPELDFLVEVAANSPGVLGARMMGGGFGGCTINLIQGDLVDDFSHTAKEKYRERFNRELRIYVTGIEEGTTVINDREFEVE